MAFIKQLPLLPFHPSGVPDLSNQVYQLFCRLFRYIVIKYFNKWFFTPIPWLILVVVKYLYTLHASRLILDFPCLLTELSSEAIIECMTTYSTSSNARLANLAKIYLQVCRGVNYTQYTLYKIGGLPRQEHDVVKHSLLKSKNQICHLI